MGLAIDGSTPAIATNTVGTVAAVTSASFNPPAGAQLLILWAGDSSGTPSQPTITDNLGAHLTYTLTDWQSHADSPGVQGQAAGWVATVGAGGAMTVTVSSGSPSGAMVSAMGVIVLTGEDTVTPVGAHGKSGSGSAAAIAQSYTAQASGGLGFIAVADFNDLVAQTAGTGCTLIGSADVAGSIVYGFVRRTSADDVNGNSNTLNVTLPGTSTNLQWIYVEIKPAAVAAGLSGQPPLFPPDDVLLQLLAAQQAQGASPAGIPPISQTDLAGLTDLFVIEQDKVVTDSAGLTDTTVLDRSLPFTDSAGLTDTSTVQVLKDVTATDSAGLTDTTVLDRALLVTDSAGLTDTQALTRTLGPTDDAGLTDTSSLQLAKLVTQTDPAGLTDSAVLDRTLAATDQAGLTDSNALARTSVLTDSSGLTDDVSTDLGKLLTQTDAAGLTDNTALACTLALSDSAGLTDSAALRQDHTFTDSAGLTDAAALLLLKLVAATDSAGLTDDATSDLTSGLTMLVGLDGAASAGTTDNASTSTGATDGRTGSSGHDGTLKAAGSSDGGTTATGYL